MRVRSSSQMPSAWRQAGLVALVGTAVAILLPLLTGRTVYAFDVAIVALAYALFAVSWDLFCGSTAELSFGHTFHVGTAAFAAALFQAKLGFSAPAGVFVGLAVGAVSGALVGMLTLRHSGAVFTMVTMAAQLSFHRTLFLWSGTFGGEEGIPMRSAWIEDSPTRYGVVAGLSVCGLTLAAGIRATSLGRALRASGGDTRVGLASGINVPIIRIWGLTASGGIAGVGGSLLALHHGVANHELAGDALAALIFLLAVTGGVNTLVGPWIAAIVYVAFLREALLELGDLEPLILVGLLMLLVWVFPRGVANPVRSLLRLRRSGDIR